jgi:hypothetical protein
MEIAIEVTLEAVQRLMDGQSIVIGAVSFGRPMKIVVQKQPKSSSESEATVQGREQQCGKGDKLPKAASATE